MPEQNSVDSIELPLTQQISRMQIFEEGQTMVISGGVKGVMKGLGAGSSDLWKVPVSELRFLPNFNARIRNERFFANVRRYANSMKREGFKSDKPLGGIILNENGVKTLYIHAGYTRGEAVALANNELLSEGAPEERLIKVVPVIVHPEGTTIEDLTGDLITGNNGEPYAPIEIAIVCQRFKRMGLGNTEIAERCQLASAQYVEGLLMLIGGPVQIRDMVLKEEVSATQAIELLRTQGSGAVDLLTQGLVAAKREGKTKVTRRFLPGAVKQKLVAKSAPVLASALSALRTDPAFGQLMPETLEAINAALVKLDEAELQAKETEAAIGEELGEGSKTPEYGN